MLTVVQVVTSWNRTTVVRVPVLVQQVCDKLSLCEQFWQKLWVSVEHNNIEDLWSFLNQVKRWGGWTWIITLKLNAASCCKSWLLAFTYLVDSYLFDGEMISSRRCITDRPASWLKLYDTWICKLLELLSRAGCNCWARGCYPRPKRSWGVLK